MEHLEFNFPEHLVPLVVTNEDGTSTQEKIDKMDMYIWKKDYELLHKRKTDFIENEKRVFPIILNQCSPSLKSQLEGAKIFEETCEKNDVMELLKLIRFFSAGMTKTIINTMLCSTVFVCYLSLPKKWPNKWWLPEEIPVMYGHTQRLQHQWGKFGTL